jgi:hypothetical protein
MLKYRKAKNFYHEIIKGNNIPNCKEILENKNEWDLRADEFNVKEEFEKVLNSNLNKNSFLYLILHTINYDLIKYEKSNEEIDRINDQLLRWRRKT